MSLLAVLASGVPAVEAATAGARSSEIAPKLGAASPSKPVEPGRISLNPSRSDASIRHPSQVVDALRSPTMKPRLRCGINITAWFRFPASRDPAALSRYMSDQALADLRTAGFDFVRLAIDPAEVATQHGVLLASIQRIQRQGLTVVVSPHPKEWHLEAGPGRLLDFWRGFAPMLRSLDPAQTVPEVLNEPVFPGDAAGWSRLQHDALGIIRQALPTMTILLTGQDWGSIGGLLALTPENDPDVVYSFHFYDPAELTSLAAYRPGLDREAMARLAFPAEDRADCDAIAGSAADPGTRDLMHYYCGSGWDAARIDARIGSAVVWSRRHNVRLIAGEFGASAALNAPARIGWLRTVHDALEAGGTGWALWGYDDVMGLAVPRPPGPRPQLNAAVLGALGLSAPR